MANMLQNTCKVISFKKKHGLQSPPSPPHHVCEERSGEVGGKPYLASGLLQLEMKRLIYLLLASYVFFLFFFYKYRNPSMVRPSFSASSSAAASSAHARFQYNFIEMIILLPSLNKCYFLSAPLNKMAARAKDRKRA